MGRAAGPWSTSLYRADGSTLPSARGIAGKESVEVDVEATLRRMFDDVINQGRLEVADEMFAEDFVDHGPMGDIQGRWLVRTTGTHTGDGLGFPATGKSFETVSANIGRFRDGLAAEHWSEQGMLPMLVQLGVMPAPGT
jgi:hypothetical protein